MFLQKAQSKKGKAAEKSPKDENPPSSINLDVVDLYNRTKAQGERVRNLKTEKAKKVSGYFSHAPPTIIMINKNLNVCTTYIIQKLILLIELCT